MLCPRCGAPAAGSRCTACGEALPFAPPQSAADAPVAPAPPAEGAVWLIVAGVLQLCGGAVLLLTGLVGALTPSSFATLMQKQPGVDDSLAVKVMVGVFTIVGLCGVATIVVSAFLIARRRWAWAVSLVFDALWVLLGLATVFMAPPAGVLYVAIGGGLFIFLMAGRKAIR